MDTESSVKFCQFCGYKITEGSGFCGECGSKVSQEFQIKPVKKSNRWKWIVAIILFATTVSIFFILRGSFTIASENEDKAIELSKEWVEQNLNEISAQANSSDSFFVKTLINYFLSWEYEVTSDSGDSVCVDAIGNIDFEIPLIEVSIEGAVSIPLVANIITNEVNQDSNKAPAFNFNFE